LTGDGGDREVRTRTGYSVSDVTDPGHRNFPCACHDVTPRIKLRLSPFRFSFSGPLARPLKSRSLSRFINLDIISLSGGSTLGTVESEVANQSRSHPPMSVTWNLVSDRARRIPARFFKIHKRNARAMNFKRTTTTEERATCAETPSNPEIFYPTC
jgi:hypothetical protein